MWKRSVSVYVRSAPGCSYTTSMMIRGASLSRRLQTHQPIRHSHELRGSFRSQPHGWSSRSYVTFSAIDSTVRLIKGTSPNERAEYYSYFLVMSASSIRIICKILHGSFSLTNCSMPRWCFGPKSALEIKLLIYNAVQICTRMSFHLLGRVCI